LADAERGRGGRADDDDGFGVLQRNPIKRVCEREESENETNDDVGELIAQFHSPVNKNRQQQQQQKKKTRLSTHRLSALRISAARTFPSMCSLSGAMTAASSACSVAKASARASAESPRRTVTVPLRPSPISTVMISTTLPLGVFAIENITK
jgi:hypothetical protein